MPCISHLNGLSGPIVRTAWAIQAKKNLHPFALDGFTPSGFELGFDHWGTICPLGYNFGGHFHF